MPENKNTIALSVESYEKRLLAQKDKFLPALTAAMEKNEEGMREKLQLAVVSVTEGLTFLKQSYHNEITCRKGALLALTKIKAALGEAAYAQATKSLQQDIMTTAAEQILDKAVGKGGKLGAFAAFNSGRLAECRIDFNRAMVRFEKAVELDRGNIHYLKAAGLLARKMYAYKKALTCFVTIEKLLAQQGKGSVELAITQRELAYTALLFGQQKQAGAYYKKAMTSLT